MTGHPARKPVDLERIALADGPAPGTKAAARNGTRRDAKRRAS